MIILAKIFRLTLFLYFSALVAVLFTIFPVFHDIQFGFTNPFKIMFDFSVLFFVILATYTILLFNLINKKNTNSLNKVEKYRKIFIFLATPFILYYLFMLIPSYPYLGFVSVFNNLSYYILPLGVFYTLNTILYLEKIKPLVKTKEESEETAEINSENTITEE